ncbi:MAG: hypothetical protein HY961_08785 [Ignavibacteriae bacterium]|nr:hypothetical protein [Ignavibacteriota bacterium]
MKRAALLVCILVVFIGSAASQVQPERDSLPAITPITPADSARIIGRPSRIDTVVAYQPTKKPGLALLFSAVLPGAGQFYNESYWKIPIVVGFGYYLASQWLDNNDSTKYYRNLFSRSITAQSPNGNSQYQLLREFYKDQRDLFSWYFFIFYMINLVDAYVDASLYDFNVGEDLSIRVRPEFDVTRRTPQVSLRISF